MTVTSKSKEWTRCLKHQKLKKIRMGRSKKEVSLKKKGSPYNPIHIKEGEVVTDITGKNWRVGKSVGAGGFGEIYLVSDDISKPVLQDAFFAAKIEPHKNGPLFVEMNFYIRVAKKEMIDQWKKERGLKHLGMPYYIAFGSHLYQNEKFRFLVLKRFGQDLGKLFNKCKRKFHVKTVLTLGIQILDILEYIHSHGYIHADIKDSNLLLGVGKDVDNVYLLDYGLACRYVNSLGEHKEYNPDQRKAHDGTLQYTSRDAHVGAHSRRSDLETLAYNMVHWLSGWLPWEDEISDPEKVAQKKQTYMCNIPAFLKKCFGEDPPTVLTHFLKYVVSLSFDAKPDYDFCKILLRQGIRQAGYVDDGKLNFNCSPVKLKNRKRIRNIDVENLVELKPLKMPRTTPRQPCVPVHTNFNRMTRQQTAANTLALRSRETFDWVKVLQSNPEKILKSQNINNDQLKKKKVRKSEKEKPKVSINEVNLKKEKENPLENPTPAMFEIIKLRNSTAAAVNPGRRTRSESHSSNLLPCESNCLTPAMEDVIRRRENATKTVANETIQTATPTARSNRSRNRTENNSIKSETKKGSDVPEVKRITRKTSAPETKSPDLPGIRKKNRKYSLQEQKLMTELNVDSERKKNLRTREPPSRKRKIRKTRKGLPTLPKSPNRKSLGYSCKKRFRRREVSPSEIDFVPRLRSGADNSEDFLVEKMLSCSMTNQKMRNYAANSGPCNRRRRCGIDYSGLSSSTRDSSIIL